VLMTSNTVKYSKINKIIFAFVLQCPKWSSEKCGVCKSFNAWADKKVSTVLLIQCDCKGLSHLKLFPVMVGTVSYECAKFTVFLHY